MKDKETKNVRMDTHENNSPSVNCAEVNAMPNYSITEKEKRTILLVLEHQINNHLYSSGTITESMYEAARVAIDKKLKEVV